MNRDTCSRIRYIDIAKCISIFSVIAGHFGLHWITCVVFTYHIPVFYLITGYFMKKESMLHFIMKKTRTLMIPYALTCIVVIFLSGATEALTGGDVPGIMWYWTRAALYGAGSSYHLPVPFHAIGAIWFLWATLWGSFFLQISLRWRTTYQLIWAGFLFMLGYLTAHKLFWFPVSIQAGACAVPYMYIGHCAKKYATYCENNENYLSPVWMKILFYISLPIWFAFIYFFDSFYLVSCDFGRGAANILASLFACYCIFAISKILDQVGGKNVDLMAFFGRNSLLMLCVHLTEMNLVDWWEVAHWVESHGVSHLVGCGIAAAIKMILIIGITCLITKAHKEWSSRA